MTTFDQLISTYLGEHDGNTGINNPTTSTATVNPKFIASTAKPAQPGQQKPNSQDQEKKDEKDKATPTAAVKPEELLKTLTSLEQHPDFLAIVQKAVEDLQKKGQQQEYIAKQQNASATTNQ